MTEKRQLQNAYRDPVSNAVINVDADGYSAAVVRKRLSRKNQNQEEKIHSLEERLTDLESKINNSDSKLDSILQLLQKSQ